MTLWCQHWQAAEQMAITHLGPRLVDAERAGIITAWWFIRKDTCWRVRYLPRRQPGEQAQASIEDMVRVLAADGAILRWARTIYEPETHAFGGQDGIDVAHELFHADSRHLLDHLRRVGDQHRSELGVLLACALMRDAAQDWYEQGDVWAQIAAHRPADRPPTDAETGSVHRLLTARTTDPGWAPAWPAAFQRAGADLADLAHDGRLTRGLRAVLAHHTLFMWNRAGISARRQALLAYAAARVVFHRETHIPGCVERRLRPRSPS